VTPRLPAGRPAELVEAPDAGVVLPCRNADPELWFPIGPRASDDDYAAELCIDCPVRAACLRDALERGEPYGVWGGMSEVTRQQLRRRDSRAAYNARRNAKATPAAAVAELDEAVAS